MRKSISRKGILVGLDTAIIEELQYVSVIGIYEDLSPVVDFVQNGGLLRAFGNILHFSAVNDLGQLTRTTQQLSAVLEVLNHLLGDEVSSVNLPTKLKLLEDVTRLDELYSMICSNLAIIYKVYGMRKPAVVVAMTRMLHSLVDYGNANIISLLHESLDLSNPGIINILTPTKDDFEKNLVDEKTMRSAFVSFWLSFCSVSSPNARRSLLTNFKIMNNFWKYLYMERFEALNKILAFVDRFVCSEPTFKRATKCRILNENFLYSARSLFSLIKPVNERQGDNEDKNDFIAFKLTFTSFMNKLVSDSHEGIKYLENELGTPLVVNNVTFTVNNKLIYTLLAAMKPWESYHQLQFVMQILNHNNELVPPYMHWIVANSGGYHDPTLSSYWVGHTLLYTEILKSESLPVKPEFISLLPLSRNALNDCINFPNDIIKQFGLQLILLQLQKLSRAKIVSQSLKDHVLSNLPSHGSFLPLITCQNKVLRLTATLIVALYEDIAPKSSPSSLLGTINKELSRLHLTSQSFDSFNLIMLDRFLSIQSNNDLKWWSKTSSGRSFFTSLVQLLGLPLIRGKTLQILRKLTKSTLIFNEERTFVSPLIAFAEAAAACPTSSCLDKLWDCLDETITRTVTTPYKYLDRSHENYEDMSIFLVALFEQLNFVKGLRDEIEILEWLQSLITSMTIIGEPLFGLRKALKDSELPITLTLANLNIGECITSRYELAKAVILLNNCLAWNREDQEVCLIMEKIGAYLSVTDCSSPGFRNFIYDSSKWKFLTKLGDKNITDHEVLAACIYIEIIGKTQANYTNSSLPDQVYNHCSKLLPKRNQGLLNRFIWILSDSQLEKLSYTDNDSIVLKALDILRRRNVKITPNFTIFNRFNSTDVKGFLLHLEPSREQIVSIIQSPTLYFLLERGSVDMNECLLMAEDLPDTLLYHVSPFYPEVTEKYRNRVIQIALTMTDWIKSLKIFRRFPELFDQRQVLSVVFSCTEISSQFHINSFFVDFANTYISSMCLIPPTVTKWLHITMLYVTKRCAESDLISESFGELLISLGKLIANHTRLVSLIPLKIMNAQFEVLLASKIWSSQSIILEYVSRVILAHKLGSLDSDRLLQIFINNDGNVLHELPSDKNCRSRFLSALIIYSLFHENGTASSKLPSLENILVFYQGSQRPEDILLKDVLKKIEKHHNKSWVSCIKNWEFQDTTKDDDDDPLGEDRLLTRSFNSLDVVLKKEFVKSTIVNKSFAQEVPQTRTYKDFEDFFLRGPSPAYRHTLYDREFLMLLLINNEELARESLGTINFDIAKLLDSELLRFIVSSLAFNEVKDIAKILLVGILKTLSYGLSNIRDKSIMKIYIASILHTLRVADHTVSLVWFMIGSFSTIIVNPLHPLYESVYHYILSTPIFKPYMIPLFNLIIASSDSDEISEDDQFQKHIIWIGLVASGTWYPEDMQLLNSKFAFESIWNVFYSNYAPIRLRTKILGLIYKVQSIGIKEVETLVTRYASLSAFEVAKRFSLKSGFGESQEKLNVDQLALRTGMLQRHKRIGMWTFDNTGRACKRIHLAKSKLMPSETGAGPQN